MNIFDVICGNLFNQCHQCPKKFFHLYTCKKITLVFYEIEI